MLGQEGNRQRVQGWRRAPIREGPGGGSGGCGQTLGTRRWLCTPGMAPGARSPQPVGHPQLLGTQGPRTPAGEGAGGGTLESASHLVVWLVRGWVTGGCVAPGFPGQCGAPAPAVPPQPHGHLIPPLAGAASQRGQRGTGWLRGPRQCLVDGEQLTAGFFPAAPAGPWARPRQAPAGPGAAPP